MCFIPNSKRPKQNKLKYIFEQFSVSNTLFVIFFILVNLKIPCFLFFMDYVYLCLCVSHDLVFSLFLLIFIFVVFYLTICFKRKKERLSVGGVGNRRGDLGGAIIIKIQFKMHYFQFKNTKIQNISEMCLLAAHIFAKCRRLII